jgi:hypothetical protein
LLNDSSLSLQCLTRILVKFNAIHCKHGGKD